jgi:hypothetical protein
LKFKKTSENTQKFKMEGIAIDEIEKNRENLGNGLREKNESFVNGGFVEVTRGIARITKFLERHCLVGRWRKRDMGSENTGLIL